MQPLSPDDEEFWGGSRRRFPLMGSYLVDSLVLAVVILAIATIVGLAIRRPDAHAR